MHEEEAQSCHDGCQSEEERRALRDYIPCPQQLGGNIDERLCGKRAPRPSEGTPKGSTQMLAVRATPGRPDYLAALVFRQRCDQWTLRKGGG
jgi:hypothetical protein